MTKTNCDKMKNPSWGKTAAEHEKDYLAWELVPTQDHLSQNITSGYKKNA